MALPAAAAPGLDLPAIQALAAADMAAIDALIRDLSESLGLTVFMITHDLDSLYAICDRVAVLADKKVVASGTIAELKKSPHPWIQEYFNGPRGRVAAAGEHISQERAEALSQDASEQALKSRPKGAS